MRLCFLRCAHVSRLAFLFLAAALAPAASAWAGPIIGIGPTGPSSLPGGPFVGDSGIGTNPPKMVEITGEGVLTPNSQDVWNKDIVWDYSQSSISPGDRLCIHEVITLWNAPGTTSGGLTIADWHEQLVGGSVPLGWEPDTASIIARIGSTPIPINGMAMISDDGRELWFKFDPLHPVPLGTPLGTPITLEIQKYIVYTGRTVITSGGQTAALEVRITEQPSTPEPSALALAGIAAATGRGVSRRARQGAGC